MSPLPVLAALVLPAPAGDLPWCEALPTPEVPAANLDESCVLGEGSASFEPGVLWRWTGDAELADVHEIMMTPVVGDLSGDGVPDVAVVAYADDAEGAGVLFVLSGDDGRTLLALDAVSDGARDWSFSAISGLALGDLDADGAAEIVGVTEGGEALLCVGVDGAPRWVAEGSFPNYDLPSIADLDGDGQAEVLAYGGAWSATGERRFSAGNALFPVAMDLDGEPGLELVAGAAAYDADGTERWWAGSGYAAVADLDLDGSPEIVVVNAPALAAYDADGALLWETVVPSPAGRRNPGGAPLIADLNGDGLPEIGVAGSDVFAAFDAEGTELWTAAISDDSARTWGAAADLDGDGAAEIVYADSASLLILDGGSGAVLFEEAEHASNTWLEGVAIADVDADGSADIIIGNSNGGGPGWSGVAVLNDPSWLDVRPVWNQSAYSITNIEDDLSVPAVQADNWAVYDSFRANAPARGPAHWGVDLGLVEATLCATSCEARAVQLWLGLSNEGRVDLEAGTLSLVREDGALALSQELGALAAGEGRLLGPLTLSASDWGEGGLVATLSPELPAGDCDEANQDLELGLWPFPYPAEDADCDGIPDGGDSGETGGETGETGEPDSAGTRPLDEAKPGCGCAAQDRGALSAGALVLLLGLVGSRRRQPSV